VDAHGNWNSAYGWGNHASVGYYKSGDSPSFIRGTFTQASGTSPFAITSTTVNTNLNADLWDGYQFANYLNQAVLTTSSPTFADANITDETKGYRVDGLRALAIKGVSGSENILLGQAGNFAMTGTLNFFMGYQAGLSNTEGSFNVAIGRRVLLNNTTGNNNIGIGDIVLQNNTIGEDNLAFGDSVLFNNTEGYQNTAVGSTTLAANTTGYGNVAIGYEAGLSNQTGNLNVFIGYQAGSTETGSNKLYIENGSTGTPLIYGEFDTPKLVVYAPLTATSFTIGANTLTTSEFGYLDGINQSLATTNSPTFANITNSGLTITRVPYASTAGLLVDSANLTFNGTTLTAGGFTTAGTVQAEQLTSTDDITMAGYLLNTMAAADAYGLVIDGDTYPLVYSASFSYINKLSRTVTGSGTTGFPASGSGVGTWRQLVWDYDFSGTRTQFGITKQIAAVSDTLSVTGDVNVTSGASSATANLYGGYSYINQSGAISSAATGNLTFNDRGVYYAAVLGSAINRTSTGTITLNVIGGEFTTSGSAPSLVGGSSDVAFNYYGGRFYGVGTTTGTSVVYGGYFSGTGGDTNWDIYAGGGSNNAFAGNTRMGGTTAPSYACDVTGTVNTAGTTSNTYRWNAATTAPSTSVGVAIVNYYGSSATNFLGDPTGWALVNIAGTDYRIPYY
jgi:hypothetical protein